MNKPTKYPVRKLALTGAARSGKDAVADHLVAKHDFRRFAFADDMKRIMHDLFPAISRTPKPRRAYQTFGEGLRNLDLPGANNVWIDACLRKVDAYIWWHAEVDERGANAVITDLRMPAEYARLRAEGYTIIRVTAPLAERVRRAEIAGDAFELADLAHNTEVHTDSFEVDAEIVNDGTLGELAAKVDAVIATLIEK